MEDIMEVVHTTKKGKKLNTLESFHIYKETKNGNQINDKMTNKENSIFETIILHDPQWGNHSYTHIRFQSCVSNRPSQKEYTTKGTGSEPDHKASLQEPVKPRNLWIKTDNTITPDQTPSWGTKEKHRPPPAEVPSMAEENYAQPQPEEQRT